MKLHIENISKIGMADLDIDGITVIAGSNNTGKSTVGKVLFALMNSFYNIDDFIKKWKPNDARNALKRHGSNLDLICKNLSGAKRRKVTLSEGIQRQYAEPIASCRDEDEIRRCMESYCLEHLELYGIHEMFSSLEVQDWFQTATEDMINTMLDYNSEYAEKHGCQEYWERIFTKQIAKSKKTSDEDDVRKAYACLKLNRERSNTISVRFERNKISEIKQEFAVEGKAFYIDSPRVVDECSVLGLMNDDAARVRIEEMLVPYRTVQRRAIVRGFSGTARYLEFEDFPGAPFVEDKAEQESNVEMQEMDEIIGRFNDELIKIMHGTLKFGQSHEQLEYSDPDYADSFTLRNLSTGAKAISLLQCILHYRVLRKKSVLILDEPEINLHPEWQTEYARIVVMLQKELDLHIVITTHSPFFLKALENAVSEYGIREKCHYYYAQNVDGDAQIRKADDDLDMVYSRMMIPLLDMLREMPI